MVVLVQNSITYTYIYIIISGGYPMVQMLHLQHM